MVAPEDRKNRKVRHTDKYLEKDTDEWIRREMKENAEYRAAEERKKSE